MHPFQVIVKFGSGLDPDFQGRAMLHWERWMREEGLPVEVLKATAPDDSKLRNLMTPEKRKEL